jgi:hypothetical protein
MDQVTPFVFRLLLPADYTIPAHWHQAIEHVTVISGTFNMGTGDQVDVTKTTALSAGSVAIMPTILAGRKRKRVCRSTASARGASRTLIQRTIPERNR